jgi:hypothetical protein
MTTFGICVAIVLLAMVAALILWVVALKERNETKDQILGKLTNELDDILRYGPREIDDNK